jgi:peptidoglycan/LPS O-acetylase OafA/YrhL
MFSWFSLQSGIRGGGYLSQIDALRGWAILLVFFFHAWGISGGSAGSEPSLWFSYVAAGRTGVTLFFVISGFLLSIPWLRAMQSPDVAMPELKELLRGSGFTDCAVVLPRRVYGLRCIGFLGHGI